MSGDVNALAQTIDGFLWIGTSSGIYRFDGISFEPYQLPAGNLPISDVRSLLATPDGGLWVGYRTGVAFIKNGQAQVYSEKQGLPYGPVRALALTKDGSIWAAVLGGFARLRNGHWEEIRWAWNYSENTALNLLVDRHGILWVTTGSGVRYLLPGETKFHEVSGDLSSVVAIEEGPNDTVWAAGKKSVFALRLSTARDKLDQRADKPTIDRISIDPWRFWFDRDGSLWFECGASQGVGRLSASLMTKAGVVKNADKFAEQFFKKDGLSSVDGYSLLEDREGNIWVGTSNGLDRFSNRNAVQIENQTFHYTLMAGMGADVWLGPADVVQPFIRAQDGKPLAIVHQNVIASFIDRTGTYWFGTQRFNSQFKQRFWRFQHGKLDMIPGPAGIPDPYIKDILSDSEGRLWLSMSGHGEYTWKSGTWKLVPVFHGKDSSLSPDRQFIDDKGHVWLTYYARQCVVLIDNGRPTFFDSSSGLDVGGPTAGGAGETQVWVAGTAGLAIFDGKRFRNISGIDGNKFDKVAEILSTHEHGLWLEGSNGVIEIAQSEIARVLHGQTTAVAYRTFDALTDFTDPLVQSDNDPGHTAVVGGDGKLWFLTQGGVSWIDPSHLFTNELPPPVSIRSITAGGIVYPATEAVKLPTKTRNLSIDYTALSLSLSERNQFKYRLVGFDADWVYAKTRRQAYYTNLPPGTYQFRVIASNNDGIWNTAGVIEEFTIPPTFIQTIWFRLIVVVLLACILLLGFSWRLRMVEHRVREHLSERLVERERIARELHDTLLQGFQGLILRFQGAIFTMPADEPSRATMEAALSGANDVLTEGRNRVRELRIERSELLTLEQQLQRAADELRIGQHASFAVLTSGSPRRLHQVVYEEAFSTAREALINACLHSDANLIEVKINYSRSFLMLTIQDDGKGIDPEVVKTGKAGHFGLSGMKERAIKMSATLRIHPSETGGTVVELIIPSRVAYFHESEGRLVTFRRRLWSRFRSTVP